MKHISNNKSLIERYEKLRASFLEDKIYNMEQEFLAKKGMIAWSENMELAPQSLDKNLNNTNKMSYQEYLNPELKGILVNMILSTIRS